MGASPIIQTSGGAPGARILGLGEYTPARVVTNEEICAGIDSSDQWIRDRSGIVTRRVAAPDESVADMATQAGSKAVADAGVTPADIDLVLVATCTHPYQTPGASTEVADRIGAQAPGAMDIGSACAGFCYALSTASDAIRGGNSRHALVIGAEKLSDFTDPYDRSTAFIFGDGAGAAVVGPSDEPGIGPIAWGSDGSHVRTITQSPTYAELKAAMSGPVSRESPASPIPPVDPDYAIFPSLRMEGPTVFRWAVTEMAPVARRALELAGLRADELGAFVPHQANIRIVNSLVKALDLPESVPVARDIAHRGNTSAASIPLALHGMMGRGEIRSGEPALFLGFGAGLVYAAQVALVP